MAGPLEIYKLLEKTNCGECNAPSCMAFASLVIQGQKKLTDCPYIGEDKTGQFEEKLDTNKSIEKELGKALGPIKKLISELDFPSSVKRLGASLVNGNLIIKCLGKNFSIDAGGNISSDCHTHLWIQLPLLDFILQSEGVEPANTWVPLHELKNGLDWVPLFNRRCIDPLQKAADEDPQLFYDIMSLFGEPYQDYTSSADLTMILYPLPKLPFLFCYWKPEDEFGSKLSILFDTTADQNLNIESIYRLGAGLTLMFEKFIYKHSALPGF